MRVKLCGMRRPKDVALACELGAWAVGFIFAPSPRKLSLKDAKALRAHVAPGVLTVGVFADSPRDEIEAVVKLCRLDAIQFHGDEKPSDCVDFGVPVFKAVAPADDLSVIKSYAVDRFLIEPRRTLEERQHLRRPTQERMIECWKFAERARGYSVILAGGLGPDNIRRAIRVARPYAVDVSGGIESSPGIKDPKLMRALFHALSEKRR